MATTSECKSGGGASSGGDQSKRRRMKTVFNDPIHGHMEFNHCLVKIIDTPQFQRLRQIKQLGVAYFVYPGASHNRFEHSLGVAHLAGELTRSLQKNQTELGITERDICCVEIAGLCHDLGHGPFSHMFEKMFSPEDLPKLKDWKHEKASVQIFEHIVQKLRNENKFDLEEELKEIADREDNDNNDLEFIKEMINGPTEEGQYKGRKENKHFLYQIVANKTTGIDVDKFDYFARDCHHLGIKSSFDHHRFIKFARVCEVPKEETTTSSVKTTHQICIRDKELSNIYEMFHTRSRLHQKAYQHKTVLIIEHMIKEAFNKAAKELKISAAIKKNGDVDVEAYTKLTDDIYGEILHATDPELKDAKEILEKVVSRNIYRHVGKTKDIKKQHQKKKLIDEGKRCLGPNFEILIQTISFGMKDKNPMANLYFYSKSDQTKPFKIEKEQVSDFLMPNNFSEDWIHVYCKNPDLSKDEAFKRFYDWCKKNDLLLPPTPADGRSSGESSGTIPKSD